MTAVLTGPGDLTTAWLSEVVGAEVSSFTSTPVGTGQVAETSRIELAYATGHSGPPAVVVKFASTDERSRSAAAMVRAYEIEVSVYAQLPPLPGVPRSLLAVRDAETNEFTLVLEDLSPCTPGDDIAGTDLATARECLRALAKLHATGWERPDFAGHEWLNRQTPEQVATMTGIVTMLAPMFLDRFGPLLVPEHRALVERLVPRLASVMGGYDGPRTLSHGDFRLDNMLFRPGSRTPSVVDWQTAVWGAPASDVAYFIGGSLLPDDRRAWSAELLDAYLAALVANGVTGFDRAQLAEGVRRMSLGGVVMAFASAVLVVQTERGDRMFAEIFARHAQHALDLDAEAVLVDVTDTSHDVVAADEGTHDPAGDELWNESWYADVVSADGTVAAYVRLGLYPNLGQAWWHAVVVGPGRPLVLSSVTTLPPSGMALAGDSVDVALSADEALRTFTVRGSTTAETYHDPADVYAGTPSGSVTVEIDATWRTVGVPYHYGMTTRYEIPCAVEGFVVIDGEKLVLDGPGQRDHSWGVRDWWTFGWCWSAGHLDDGTHVHLTDVRLDGARFAAGYVQADGAVTPIVSGQVTEEPGDFPTRATAVLGDLTVEIEPLQWGPILLTAADGRTGKFPRASARFTASDGRTGTGWVEWNQP
jgi:hypothetical protein